MRFRSHGQYSKDLCRGLKSKILIEGGDDVEGAMMSI